MKQSRLPGYPNGALFRVHNGNYSEAVDMEDPKTPLFANANKVPHLPVPDLEATLQMFLKSTRPHVTPQEYKKTEAAVAEILAPNSFGRELHKRLLARAEECNKKRNTSWFIDWWNQWAYLAYRDSVVWNVSYELLFKDECASAMRNYTRRAARFMHHALAYRQRVMNGTLPPDRDPKTGLPWENSQHKYVFNCCRMPQPKSDVSRTYAPDLFPHIVVARRGRFYAFDVADSLGNSIGVDAIKIQFDRVLALADRSGFETRPVGILTADDRDVWSKTRLELLRGPGASMNEASLEKIQSAICVVCFDEASPTTRKDVARQMLHGDGRNRFWDKSFQIVVTSNGKMGYVGEHSMTDGMTTTRFVNFVLDQMTSEPESKYDITLTPSSSSSTSSSSSVATSSTTTSTITNNTTKKSSTSPYSPGSASPLPPPQVLEFVLTSEAATHIKKAEETFDAMILTKELEVLMWYGFGADRIKKYGVSPDAFAQMAMQLAYRLTFGHCRATYESTQTRTYQHGRTEVTRSCSVESEIFCDGMLRSLHYSDLYKLLRDACNAHSAYTAKAAKGFGCDRHLLALKFLIREGEKTPSLFNDPGYLRSNHWAISTSGLVGEFMDGWAFGEVVPDGIGIGYSVQKARLRFSVSSRHPQQKWAACMVQNLETALNAMGEVCEYHLLEVGGSNNTGSGGNNNNNKEMGEGGKGSGKGGGGSGKSKL
jgi:carnitine O-acetyltransferase